MTLYLVLIGSVPKKVFASAASALSYAQQHGADGAVLSVEGEL